MDKGGGGEGRGGGRRGEWRLISDLHADHQNHEAPASQTYRENTGVCDYMVSLYCYGCGKCSYAFFGNHF